MLTKSSAPSTQNTSTSTIAPAAPSTPLFLSPPPFTLRDHLIEYTFQILGITAAIIFGVWSIKSYSTSITANSLSSRSLSLATQANDIAQTSFQQTMYQNQLALLSFCAGNKDTRFNETCVEVLEFMAPPSATDPSGGGGLAIIAFAVMIAATPSASETPSASPEADRPAPELPFGAIVGIIVLLVVIAGVIAVFLLKRTRRPHSLQRRRVDENEERIERKA
jgi:hypothetical protein